MTGEDVVRFASEMARMSDYYERPMSESMVELYLEDLERYTIEEVLAGIRAHRRDPDRGRFFPKTAEIIAALEGRVEDRALFAWGRAVRAAIEVGSYASVVFDDPVITRVIADMGGWPGFYGWPDDEMPFRRKEFCDRYSAWARRATPGAAEEVLVGLHEANNTLRGHEIAPPVKIVALPVRATTKAIEGR